MTQPTLAAEGRQEVEPAAESAPAGGVVAAPSAPLNGSDNDGLPSGVPEQSIPAPRDANEALPLLRRPFTPEAIRFKIQGTYGDYGCYAVAYIDARLVTERLNLICRSHWREDYEGTNDGMMICRLSIFDAEPRQDVGEGKGKALRSDAFKRAAVKWGVGVSVYAAPRADLWWRDFGTDDGGKGYIKRKKKKTQKGEVWEYRLEPKGEEALRERYRKWLESPAGLDFGEPISHGDVVESAGEAPLGGVPDESGTQSDLAPVKQPLTDEQADALRVLCREAYARVDKKKMPKARFESELRQASTSHAELEAFAEKLRGMASS